MPRTPARENRTATGFTPRRGRPSAAQLAAIAETILTTAQALFLSQGYANTTMEAVAASAGVGKATLYARYPTKHDLFLAVVEERMAAWQARGANQEDLDDESEIGPWLTRRAAAMLRAFRNPEIRAFDQLVTSEAPRFPEVALAFHELGFMLNVGHIAARLTRADGQEIVTSQTLLAAKLFASSLIGWFRQESYAGEVSDAACDAAADTLARLFVDGRAAWRRPGI